MTRDVLNGIALIEVSGEPRELGILGVREGDVIASFQFDADGEVVTALAPAPMRRTGMPRAPLTRHELDQLSVATDEEMARDLEAAQAVIEGMGFRIEPIEEEIDEHRSRRTLPAAN